jgi:hypothetical protein
MTRRTATTAAIILSLGAASAPAASASPVDFVTPSHESPAAVYSRPDRTMIPVALSHESPAAVYSRPDRTMIPVTAPYVGPVAQTTAPQALVRVQAPQSGFDWGEVGIGAAGLALSVIGIGGAFAVSQRRSRRTTALPS